jgi:2-polyprenyl-3-methyl-5-hydroxy-6-metoxy-1,4-benzoquinol methylase
VALKLREWVGSFTRSEKSPPGESGAGPVRAADRAASAAAAAPPPAANAAEAALEDRLSVLAALWGEGFTGPGGEEEALRLSKPLGLSSSHSLLHLGAGLGGGTRAIAKASGAYVTGYEADATLIDPAGTAAQKAGLAKRAAVLKLDTKLPALRQNYFHHALSQEALWPLADKQPVLGSLIQAVKVGGQLMISDLVRAEGDPNDPQWSAWAVLERAPPHLSTEKATGKMLLSMGLDIRIVEDVSQRHMNQALTAWMNRVTILRRTRPTPRQAALLVREAELWLRRCRLMQDGRMRMLRWHAIRVK